MLVRICTATMQSEQLSYHDAQSTLYIMSVTLQMGVLGLVTFSATIHSKNDDQIQQIIYQIDDKDLAY